ncbi:MAG: DNA polymerase III subunit delta' [Gammaproteobacteria bacterium]
MNSLPEFQSVPLPWQIESWQRSGTWLASGKLPHALMITGAAGTGKELFARAFAALALCRHPESGRACGRCPSCHQFAAGAHPDYHFVTVPEDKTGILVEQIRELARELVLTSQHGGRKIAVLSPADAMNVNAANSLLKTLEEPTAETLLMLVTARPARLPATVRSRCQVLRVATPAADGSTQWLNSQETRNDWPALLGIAGGGPLMALQLAQNSLVQERLRFFQVLAELRSGRRNPVKYAAEASREPLPLVLRLLQSWVMDMITLATTLDAGEHPAIINSDALALLQSTIEGLNLRGLHAYLGRLNEAVALAATPVNGQLLLENLLVEWADGLQALGRAPLAARGG